jgi:hypothetical protein
VGIGCLGNGSAHDIWAVGGSTGILLRFNGRRWGRVRGKALTGLQFGALLAVSPGNVWVDGGQFLLHLKGTAWSELRFPEWPVTPLSMAPDGSGGLWMNNFAINASVGPTVVHLSRAGRWRQYRVPGSGLMYDLARIPGTSSLWGTGDLAARTAVDAAIWAYGPVG